MKFHKQRTEMCQRERSLDGVRERPRNSRSMGIDMLRGVAVLLVLFRHHPAAGVLNRTGWVGVDLFFVLSGFLVSGLIFDEYNSGGTFHGGRFLIRRGFKIYPSFYFMIATSAVLMWVTDRQDPVLNYIAEVFFFQNYHEGLWVHTWSLAVEEHFYLVLVAVALLLISIRVPFNWRTMVVVSVVVFVLLLVLRLHIYESARFAVRTHFMPTHLRLDSLLAGVLLAAWSRYRPGSFARVFGAHRLLLALLSILLLVPALLFEVGSWSVGTFGLSGAYLAGAMVVGMAWYNSASMEDGALSKYVVGPLAWVGSISYTVYLWHLLVLLVVELIFDALGIRSGILELLAYCMVSVVVGALAHNFVEKPFLRLRDVWFPSRTRPLSAQRHRLAAA